MLSDLGMRRLERVLPQQGRVEWIGVRAQRKQPLTVVDAVEAKRQYGLVGDRSALKSGGKRQVSLIQAEHLTVMSNLLHQDVTPERLRRNLVVSGINLLALKGKQFRLGTALLEYSGLCHPCSRMEEELGPGGFNAMRGHGGILATVVESGVIRLHDLLSADVLA